MKPVLISLLAVGCITTAGCKFRTFNTTDGEAETLISGTSYEIDENTIIKKRAVPSADLAKEEMCSIPKGTKLVLVAKPTAAENSHVKVEIREGLPEKCDAAVFSSGLIFEAHILGIQQKRLKVPYFCQLNNASEPYATCNNTSLAMVLAYHGKTSLGGYGKLPDQIYAKFGKANSVEALKNVAQSLGFSSVYKKPGSMELIKQEIDAGNPVIVGADFTGSVGHFVVITGYDETGVWVNDPYGQWDQQTLSPNNGYHEKTCNNGYTGQDRHYSYRAMDRAGGGTGMFLVLVDK